MVRKMRSDFSILHQMVASHSTCLKKLVAPVDQIMALLNVRQKKGQPIDVIINGNANAYMEAITVRTKTMGPLVYQINKLFIVHNLNILGYIKHTFKRRPI